MGNRKSLSESDICDQFITPSIEKAGWNKTTQIRREFGFTDGRVIVRGKIAARGKRQRADYLLFYDRYDGRPRPGDRGPRLQPA